jgi:6,7-dimethyl-8-ribityllumazine synthase
MTRAGSSSALPDLDGSGLRIAIIGARFNDHIVTNLRDGALNRGCLARLNFRWPPKR